MGRPLRKDINGVDVIGTYATTSTGLRIEFYNGSLRTDGVILKQRGAKTFRVCRIGSIGTTSAYATCVLKNGAPSALGEMRLWGYVGSNSGTSKNIKKITKRIATDFNGVRYRWQLENDSSNDYIVLTAV
jgi:hypothetical protein